MVSLVVVGTGRGVGSWGASWPVLWMIEPSLRERIRVDWTPGREVRWDSNAVTCWGTCCVRCLVLVECLFFNSHMGGFRITYGGVGHCWLRSAGKDVKGGF